MTRRGVTILLIVLVLAGGAVFASIQLLAGEKVVYLAVDATSSDPFTPPAVFTSDSPAPPQPIDPSVPLTTPTVPTNLGDNPGPVGGTVSAGDCDAELMIQFLNANEDRLQGWLIAAGIAAADFEDYVRGTTPALLSRDTRVTNYGFGDGSPVKIQSILASGTSVMVDGNGDIVIRCMSGSPLDPPEKVNNYRCDGCPSDLGATPPCNQTCYELQGALSERPTTTTSVSTSSTLATTTTRPPSPTTTRGTGTTSVRRVTTTRRSTTAPRGTQAPVTATFFSTQPSTAGTFPPAATQPPTTQPPATQPTAPTIPPATFPPAATTTRPPTTTTEPETCLPIIGCL